MRVTHGEAARPEQRATHANAAAASSAWSRRPGTVASLASAPRAQSARLLLGQPERAATSPQRQSDVLPGRSCGLRDGDRADRGVLGLEELAQLTVRSGPAGTSATTCSASCRMASRPTSGPRADGLIYDEARPFLGAVSGMATARTAASLASRSLRKLTGPSRMRGNRAEQNYTRFAASF